MRLVPYQPHLLLVCTALFRPFLGNCDSSHCFRDVFNSRIRIAVGFLLNAYLPLRGLSRFVRRRVQPRAFRPGHFQPSARVFVVVFVFPVPVVATQRSYLAVGGGNQRIGVVGIGCFRSNGIHRCPVFIDGIAFIERDRSVFFLVGRPSPRLAFRHMPLAVTSQFFHHAEILFFLRFPVRNGRDLVSGPAVFHGGQSFSVKISLGVGHGIRFRPHCLRYLVAFNAGGSRTVVNPFLPVGVIFLLNVTYYVQGSDTFLDLIHAVDLAGLDVCGLVKAQFQRPGFRRVHRIHESRISFDLADIGVCVTHHFRPVPKNL